MQLAFKAFPIALSIPWENLEQSNWLEAFSGWSPFDPIEHPKKDSQRKLNNSMDLSKSSQAFVSRCNNFVIYSAKPSSIGKLAMLTKQHEPDLIRLEVD